MALIPDDRKIQLLYEKDENELTDDEVKLLLEAELKNWNKIGMNPGQIGHDIFAMDTQIMVIIEVLVEANIMDVDVVNEKFRKRTFIKLRDIRIAQQSLMVKENILKGVHIPVPKDILGDNGGQSN